MKKLMVLMVLLMSSTAYAQKIDEAYITPEVMIGNEGAGWKIGVEIKEYTGDEEKKDRNFFSGKLKTGDFYGTKIVDVQLQFNMGVARLKNGTLIRFKYEPFCQKNDPVQKSLVIGTGAGLEISKDNLFGASYKIEYGQVSALRYPQDDIYNMFTHEIEMNANIKDKLKILIGMALGQKAKKDKTDTSFKQRELTTTQAHIQFECSVSDRVTVVGAYKLSDVYIEGKTTTLDGSRTTYEQLHSDYIHYPSVGLKVKLN